MYIRKLPSEVGRINGPCDADRGVTRLHRCILKLLRGWKNQSNRNEIGSSITSLITRRRCHHAIEVRGSGSPRPMTHHML
jgi:hypothetical protein